MLTNEQVLVIRANWDEIARRPDETTETFYRILLASNPSLRPMFAHVDMPRLREKLATTLGLVVRSLDQVDELVRLLGPLGRAHTGYGVRPDHYPLVRKALLMTLGSILGPAFTDDARNAWGAAIEFMEGIMLDGGVLE